MIDYQDPTEDQVLKANDKKSLSKKGYIDLSKESNFDLSAEVDNSKEEDDITKEITNEMGETVAINLPKKTAKDIFKPIITNQSRCNNKKFKLCFFLLFWILIIGIIIFSFKYHFNSHSQLNPKEEETEKETNKEEVPVPHNPPKPTKSEKEKEKEKTEPPFYMNDDPPTKADKYAERQSSPPGLTDQGTVQVRVEMNYTYIKYALEKADEINEEIKIKKKEEKEKLEKEKEPRTINICMSTDHGYVYPTLVSMTSACINAYNNTIYSFRIMVPSLFKKTDKNILKSIEKKFNRCKITFINMKDDFEKVQTSKKIPLTSYYRLAAPSRFRDLRKIIYMDGDTLVFEDLSELYNLDIDKYYLLGLIDNNIDLESWRKDVKQYVCSGIMLMNLALMRYDKIEEKIREFIASGAKLTWHDQTALNHIAYDKIGPIPCRFAFYNHKDEDDIIEFYYNFPPNYNKYPLEEIIAAHRLPAIVHMISGIKPWHALLDEEFFSDSENRISHKTTWWEYANHTDYAYNITVEYH